jgi:hypothetical protein
MSILIFFLIESQSIKSQVVFFFFFKCVVILEYLASNISSNINGICFIIILLYINNILLFY